MALTDLGRRFGIWLGIEPDDPEPALGITNRNVSAIGRDGISEHTPQERTLVKPRPASRVISLSPAVAAEVDELRRLISDLESGLDQRHEA